jgi:hypothetical protein
LQLLTLGAQVSHVLTEAGQFLLVVSGVKGADDGVGLAVEGLAGDAAPGCVLANGALRPEEDNSGAGNAGGRQ